VALNAIVRSCEVALDTVGRAQCTVGRSPQLLNGSSLLLCAAQQLAGGSLFICADRLLARGGLCTARLLIGRELLDSTMLLAGGSLL